MSQELHYTSVSRGLKPGSRGFSMVAATAGLPDLLADRLESLSAYQSVYPPGDPLAALNPVVHAHVRLTVAGKALDVLSRIGPAGLDYSGRPNKYAHHVVLEPEERPEGGPAWLLSLPGFLQTAWEDEPRILPEGRTPPRGDRPAGIADAWHTLTGDAGWAGMLAESFLADPRRPVFLVFRPGMNLLPLFVEAIALLPPSRRWEVGFSTYFTTLPQGITCTWRGVLDGSSEAKNARRLPNAMVVDLCRPLGRARGGELIHLARTGQRRERLDSSANPLPAPLDEVGWRPSAANGRPILTAGPPTHTARPGPPTSMELPPEPTAQMAAPPTWPVDGAPGRPGRRPTKTQIAVVIASCLVPLIAAGLLGFPDIRGRLRFESERSRPNPEEGTRVPKIEEDALAQQAAQPGTQKMEKAAVDKEPAVKSEPQPIPIARTTQEAAGKPGETATVEAKPQARDSTPAIAEIPRHEEPIILAFSLPVVPKSQLGSQARQPGELSLPEDVNDHFEILNAPELQLIPPSTTKPLEIVSQPGNSRLASNSTLARLVRVSPHSWRFEWTKEAKIHSTLADSLRDAVLKFETREGRAIVVLLRGLVLHDERPLSICDKQPLLFDRLEPRSRSVSWTRVPGALEGTKWKLSIRRWKVVISRPDPGSPKFLRRVIEPRPIEEGKDQDGTTRVKLEYDLIPGEVTLKLAIDPANPDVITVRIHLERGNVLKSRERRASRLKEQKEDTPLDKENREQDPIQYRRAKLQKLEEALEKTEDEIKTVKREIRELEELNAIRQVEDLLSKPARTELSVVIGLDVGGSTTLDIVKIGEFTD